MSNMYGTIGTFNYDHLLVDPNGADKIAIPCTPGKGEIKRGQVMFRESNGFWSPAATSDIATNKMLAIIDEDIDTGSGVDAGGVAENAAAYRAGRFIDGKVKYDNSGTLTAVTAAHKIVLRQQGIVFGESDSAGEFDNGTYTITYVANNSADPAEPDVKDGKVAGASYTVLNNSNAKLGFTPPSGKEFSKWNTKANGSGTDYSAAATYSTDADLTLYAVWANVG